MKLVKGANAQYLNIPDYVGELVAGIGPVHQEEADNFQEGAVRNIAFCPEFWVINVKAPTTKSDKLANVKIGGRALAPAFYLPNPKEDPETVVFGVIEIGEKKAGKQAPYILNSELSASEEKALDKWFDAFSSGDLEDADSTGFTKEDSEPDDEDEDDDVEDDEDEDDEPAAPAARTRTRASSKAAPAKSAAKTARRGGRGL